jgi:hypothetical protein
MALRSERQKDDRQDDVRSYEARISFVLGNTPFYIGAQQFEYWQHTQLLIDVVPGRGGGFSLEAPLGVRFLTRSRVFDEAEQAWLEGCPAPRGPREEWER